MFEAVLGQAQILKKIIDIIKDLVTDVNFECSAKGISLQSMDSAHVSLIFLLLKASEFSFYRCDRALSIGINLEAMSKILKCAGNNDRCTLQADDDGDSMTFIFQSPNDIKASKFCIKLLHIDSEKMGIPKTIYDAIIDMNSDELQKICRDLSVLGADTVDIDVEKSSIGFSVSGDLGSGEIVCKQKSSSNSNDTEDLVNIKMKNPIKLGFALRYLSQFSKASILSDDVSISMLKDAPIAIEYSLGQLGFLKFFLAPKFDNDQ